MIGDKFEVAVEFIPPYSPDTESLMTKITELKERGVSTVSIASNPMGKPKLPALYVAQLMSGLFNRIVHYPCSGRSSIIFRSDMMEAAAIEVEAVLILAGDLHPECSNKIFARDRISIMKEKPFDTMLVGAAANPQRIDLDNLKGKIDAGADFFETQPVFDTSTMVNFMEKTESLDTPTLVGIMVPRSLRQLYAMKDIPGVVIPESYLAVFYDVTGEAEFKVLAVRTALDLIEQARAICGGVYLSVAPDMIPSFEEVIRGSTGP